MSQTGLSHAVGPTDVPLLERTIGDDLHATAERYRRPRGAGGPPPGRSLDVCRADRRVDELARALVASGYRRGDRIGIWAPNCSEWVLVQYATARIGVILVNINPAYRTHEVRYALQQSGCRGLVAATEFKSSDYVAMVDEVRPDLPDLEQVVHLGTDGLDRAAGACRRRADSSACARSRPSSTRPTRSTSSTRRAPPASRRAPRSATATS